MVISASACTIWLRATALDGVSMPRCFGGRRGPLDPQSTVYMPDAVSFPAVYYLLFEQKINESRARVKGCSQLETFRTSFSTSRGETPGNIFLKYKSWIRLCLRNTPFVAAFFVSRYVGQ